MSMDSTEQSEASVVRTVRDHQKGPLLKAALVSMMLHTLLMGWVFIETGFRPPVRVEFEETRGVALLRQSGQAPDQQEPTEQVRAKRFRDRMEELAKEPEVDPDDPNVIDPGEEKRKAEAEARRKAEAERRRREAKQRREAERRRKEAAEAQRAAKEEQKGGAGSKALPPSERYPPGTLHPVATDVGMWGPEGASLVVILRNDRIRRSVHRSSVKRVLSSFPDWKSLLGHADLDPIEDVDTLLIASSDPRYIQYTFLAAVHTIPPSKIVDVLSAGFPDRIEWTSHEGRLIGDPEFVDIQDPRKFVIPTENLFIFSRPEFVAPLVSDASLPVGLEEATSVAMSETEDDNDDEQKRDAVEHDAEEQSPAAESPESVGADNRPPVRSHGWMEGLLHLADFGGSGSDGPAVIVSSGAIRSISIRGLGDAPKPQSLHGTISAERNPVVNLRFVFANQSDAVAFRDAWPDILEANASSIRLVGLRSPLEKGRWRIDHNEAYFEFSIPADLLRRMAVTVSRIMNNR